MESGLNVLHGPQTMSRVVGVRLPESRDDRGQVVRICLVPRERGLVR